MAVGFAREESLALEAVTNHQFVRPSHDFSNLLENCQGLVLKRFASELCNLILIHASAFGSKDDT